MFEKALIRNADGREIDIGLIAETIFFYGHTQLLMNRSVLQELTKIPLGDLLALASRGCLHLTYMKPMFGVHSSGPVLVHDFVAFEIGSKNKSPKIQTYQEEIQYELIKAYGKSTRTQRDIKKFIDKVRPFKHQDFNSKGNIVSRLAKDDVKDKIFTNAAAHAALNVLAPSYNIPPNSKFEIIDTGRGYIVDSNIDLQAVSSFCDEKFGNKFTNAHILGLIQEARADTFFAAHYMAEVVTTEVSSRIIKLKHYDFIRRSELSRSEIDAFTDIASDRCPSIRETIMSGNRNVSDFLNLLDQADKFKSWLQSNNPDQGLLNSYVSEATNKTWAESIPCKSMRIAVLTGLGVVAETIAPTGLAIAATTLLSVGDSFLLERLLKGWKPAQFIAGPYLEFVDPTNR